MEMILIAVCVCLLFSLTAAVLRLIQIKRELRRFSDEVEKLKETDYNQPLKLTCFDKDITVLAVKINEHVEIQHNLSAEYEREKNKLNNVISGISHDFRTPLTASLGYLQLIEKSKELSAKNSEYLAVAADKNRYLKELSDEFFELTKLENGNEHMTKEKINLSNLLSDGIIEQYERIKCRNITPQISIADGVIIECNRQYMTRIVQNLFSNAEKYAFQSFGVSLSETDNRITLTVFNDIEESSAIDIGRVFEPFYRACSRNKNGSGLGLYVVKCLSEKMGFKVSAAIDESRVFTVTLVL